jgi:hypothetical protein
LIFDKQIEPYQMEKFINHLHDETVLYKLGYPNNSIEEFETSNQDSNSQLKRIQQYLTDPNVFNSGQIIEWVDTTSEIEAMISMQRFLRETVANVGLVVEINPTSNLLIGNLADLRNHPLWRINPPEKTIGMKPIPVSIGSDDPITFATNLKQEYALLYESLIAGGLTDSQASTWIEHARDTGVSSRFTKYTIGEIDVDDLFSHHAIGLDENVHLMP